MEPITVQYIPCGHVDWSRDPEHIKLDVSRRAAGYLDALILPSDQCEECRMHSDMDSRRYTDYDMGYYDQ